MLAVPDADTACIDPFFAKPTVSVIANIVDPVTGKDFSPRSAARRPQGRSVPEGVGHRRHLLHRTGAGVLHLRRGPLRAEPAPRATTRSTRPKAPGTRPRIEEPNLGYKPSFKGGYFPVSPTDTLPRPARRDGLRDAQGRHRRRGAPPRGRDRRAERDRHAVPAAAARWPISSCGTSTSARTSRSATARP